jgi:TPR repeat protein
MIRTHPASAPIVAFFSLSLSAAPLAHSQQAQTPFPAGGQASANAEEVKLCVPRGLVEGAGFEQPVPGSKMEAFHTALRNFLRDHGDARLEYRVRQNAFEIFGSARDAPRELMDEVSADADCPADDYSYTLPVKRVSQNAAQDAGAAQQSSSRDSLYRGWQYQVGSGVSKDPAMAARLYTDAANQNVPDAMYRLALLYRDGNGVAQDSAAALNWFYQAAKQGHSAAQMELGFAFITGTDVRHDDVAGFRWLQLAAQAGLPQAEATLGAMYETGRGVAQNESEAAVWFQRAAQQGQIIAMFELGQSLRLGRGIPRNERDAVQWYEKSANAGYAPAQAQLGFGYLTGSGTARDYRLAAHWLTEAARQGEPYAQLNLGTMYEDGNGVDRNLAQARVLYAQAARSQVPQVAERARQLTAALPGSSDASSQGDPAANSNMNAVIGVAATVLVGAALISLLARSNSGDSAAGPPDLGSSSVGRSFDSNTSSSSSRSTPPPAPHCHMAPVENPFAITPGVYTPHGGSTLVCD